MKKRLLKTAIATALTVAFTVPAFANPFADVPAKHWAYDAVNKLVQAGVVDGYDDGTFRGDKAMTRYEMAQIVAKAMNKSLNADQKATVDKLAQEFSTELNNLGVKVDGLQNQVDNMVKISGDARVRFFDHATATDHDVTDYKARISFDGKINDNMKFNARLSSGNALSDGTAGSIVLDTANVNFDALGFNNTVGRQDVKLGSGFIVDNQMNGIASKIGDLTLFAGNVTTSTKLPDMNGATAWNRAYGAEYSTKIGEAKFTADYLKNTTNNDNFYGVGTSFRVTNGLMANAEYVKNNEQDATAKAYGLKLDKVGLSATYRDVEPGALTAYSGLNATTTNFYDVMSVDGFKGMEYQYDHNLDKNAVLTVKYQDFEQQNGNKLDGRTSAAVNIKF